MEDEVDSLEHIMALVHNNPMDPKRNNNYPRNLRNPQPLEEPSYRLLPTSENHASSFGAGGTISQVVDPHFRQPTSAQNFHTFGQMLDNATMSSNIMSSTLLDYGPPVTVSNFNNINNGFILGRPTISPPPPPPPPPAYDEHQNHLYHQQQQQQQHHHNHQMQPHLQNQQPPHHHNPFLPPEARQTASMDSYRSSANEPFRPPYVSGGQSPQPPAQIFLPNRNQMPPIITTSAPSMRPSNIGQANPTINNQSNLTFTPSTSQHIRPASSSSSSGGGNFNASYMPRTNDGPLYSPKPKNPSPPLDQINMPNISAPNPISSSNNNPNPGSSGQNSRGNFNHANPSSSSNPSAASSGTTNLTKTTFSSNKPASVGEALGRIPKKKSEPPKVSDRYDEMSMLVLQEKFRECEARLDVNRKKRQEVEKVLNDMARNSHGKNIELDPRFREKKDEQRQCDETAQEIRAKMKKISEKLLTKFNHKIVPKPIKTVQMAPNRQPPKRAKMSTAAIMPRKDLVRDDSPQSNKDRARLMLNMGESKIWCKMCDIHFESFKEYCDHLHKKDHLRNMKRSHPPWHRSKDKIDRSKTYNMIKSICARVSNDVDSEFSIAKLTKLLSPIGTDEKSLKNMNLERERGNFDEDDPLLHVKGYENLVPISGYFCQLCDRAYCDFTAIDQHVKSYDHNYRYAISVANDEASERTFRELQEKSHKKQHPEKEKSSTGSVDIAQPSSDKQSLESAVEAPSTSSSLSATRAITAPPAQYKKSTSRIVDEHEAVVEKFPASAQPERRPASPVVRKKSSNHSSARSKRILESDESEDESRPPPPPPPAKNPPSSPGKRQTSSSSASAKIFVKNRIPDIVPIRDSRTKPSALKQLRNEKRPKPISKPYVSSSDSSESSSDSEIEILDTSELATGDPDSPFPDLILASTGNIHMDVLKDKRLSLPCIVKMNRINIDDYKSLLMDQTTLWSRISHLLVKGEGDPRLEELKKQLSEKYKTRPTYFTTSGSTIPVDVDKEETTKDKTGNGNDDNDDSDLDEKPKLSSLLNGDNSGGGSDNKPADEQQQQDSKNSTQQSQKSSTTIATNSSSANPNDNDNDNDSDVSDLDVGSDKGQGVKVWQDLTEFFCEK